MKRIYYQNNYNFDWIVEKGDKIYPCAQYEYQLLFLLVKSRSTLKENGTTKLMNGKAKQHYKS